MRALMLWIAGCVLVASACNSLDAPGPKGSVEVIPVDDRPALLTAAPPAPISGGTLAVSADGATAVAADPDRDRISIVDLSGGSVRHVLLEKGDEPGRVVLDAGGRAFVALRRSGALAVVDLAQGSLIQRMPVCAAPRGMAIDAVQGLLHVACMEGRLLSLNSSSLAVARDVRVELDLRDVIVKGAELWVSTFKRAELLQVGESGQVRQRITPQTFAAVDFNGFDPSLSMRGAPGQMQPRVAYRSVADGAGNMFVLHQAESDGEVAIDEPAEGQSASPYGAGGACGGIVTPALTTVEPSGRVRTFPASTGVLSVDMAFAPEGNSLAVVQAGTSDGEAPLRQRFFDSDGSFAETSTVAAAPGSFFGGGGSGSGSLVTVFDMSVTRDSCQFGQPVFVPGQATAIAFRPRTGSTLELSTPSGWVVQSREPARIVVVPLTGQFAGGEQRLIELGGESMRDSGHEIFHRDAGGGIACASCHAEGGEDGHVWHFTRLGARRTQALHIGLEGTAPFHWGGDESDLDNLMTDVFVGRMGGVHQNPERISALSRWLFALQPPAAPSALDGTAVERGRELFMSAAVGCNECHSGAKLTNNKNVDVGTGEALQVPSLRGIAYRAPFMHNGCAATLRDRFTLGCGGATHGNTSQLSSESVDDLVAFLQTL
jgi:hypothetical protein